MGIKWKKDYSAKTQRFFGVAVGLGVGTLLGLVIAKGWPEANWLLDWTAVAAVATAVAAGVALWLGLKQIQFVNSTKEHEARIVAAYMVPVLEEIARTLKFVVYEFKTAEHKVTSEIRDDLLYLWTIEKITIREVVSYSWYSPYQASVLGDNIASLLLSLEVTGIPRGPNSEFSAIKAIRNMQTPMGEKLYGGLSASMFEIASKMKEIIYQRPPS